jgi:hypothetical protein
MLDLEPDEMTAEFIQETLITKGFLEDNIQVLINDHVNGGINF